MPAVVPRAAAALQAQLAERLQEPDLELRRDLLRLDATGGGDQHAELLEVGGARLALLEMGLQAQAVAFGQHAVQVVGEHLHELLAWHLGQLGHASASSWARTLERARCSSTRWLPSLSSSASQTSAPSHPCTSLRVMTARCIGGRRLIASRTWAMVSAVSTICAGSMAQWRGHFGWSAGRKRSGSTDGPSSQSPSGSVRGS